MRNPLLLQADARCFLTFETRSGIQMLPCPTLLNPPKTLAWRKVIYINAWLEVKTGLQGTNTTKSD